MLYLQCKVDFHTGPGKRISSSHVIELGLIHKPAREHGYWHRNTSPSS